MRVVILVLFWCLTAAASWPEATRESRPWSYWWWPASAVDEPNITRELERFQKAGWGGVHIIPIYGVRGAELRYIDYLSPRWMSMLKHTVTEANRLGLGVDMTLGTGWCFGGPSITSDLASVRVNAKKSAGGAYALTLRRASRVKRAAPGGEGWMLNPFYGAAIDAYLVPFTKAFGAYDGPLPRAVYQDSFEYQVDWSPDLAAEFERRRGYRLEDEYDSLFGAGADDRAARVKADYRETLSDLLLENFTKPWVDWAHRHRFQTRNEAHGSPGNLLDLYAAADTPETEMFNRDRSTLISKFASSAAHVAGRRLVSSETGTWLNEHFTETLANLKELIDQLFLAGVNHVFYHGSCYSPDDAAWPGWLFYASTEMNSRNAFWRDVPALNSYVSRAQSMLQNGRHGNDVLLYWPVHDVWHNPGGLAQQFTVHWREWIEDQPFGKYANRLYERGWGFDLISDRQLAEASVEGAEVVVPGGSYRAILVASCQRMPVPTLKQLIALAGKGASVIFDDAPPVDVPGLASLEQRQAELRSLTASLSTVRGVSIGSAEPLLEKAGARREALVDIPGLFVLRRVSGAGREYFIVNRGARAVDAWVPLAHKTAAALLLDPMTGRTGAAAVWNSVAGSEIYLQLEPGASVFVRALAARPRDAAPWPYVRAGESVALNGPWSVEFVSGGPELPKPARIGSLASWTRFGGEAGERFAGTARYTLTFDALAGREAAWMLDLGDVRESARVVLNGRDLGVVFMKPYRVRLEALKPAGNRLEVEVTNLSANRIRDLDRRKVQWRIFHDINFVNMDYRPFDASAWPVRDSGLLGPVVVRRLETVRPFVGQDGIPMSFSFPPGEAGAGVPDSPRITSMLASLGEFAGCRPVQDTLELRVVFRLAARRDQPRPGAVDHVQDLREA